MRYCLRLNFRTLLTLAIMLAFAFLMRLLLRLTLM
jgi:hypothetical protein